MISRIVTVEILAVLVAGMCLTPIILAQAILGQWAGLVLYAKAACWGGVFLTASEVLLRAIVRW